MPIQFSPDDFQNNDFQLAQNNAGDLVLEHKQTGGRFKFDATTDSWVPVQGLDLQGADIVNVGASKTNFTEKADLTSSNGVLQSSQLPDLAITNIDVVANQSERLSLTAEEGDVAVQTDVSQTFILATNDPTVDSNWKQVQLDVLGAIDGQTITPAQTGTSTNPTTVESDTVTATNVEADQIGDPNNSPDVFADTVDASNIRANSLVSFVISINNGQTKQIVPNNTTPFATFILREQFSGRAAVITNSNKAGVELLVSNGVGTAQGQQAVNVFTNNNGTVVIENNGSFPGTYEVTQIA